MARPALIMTILTKENGIIAAMLVLTGGGTTGVNQILDNDAELVAVLQTKVEELERQGDLRWQIKASKDYVDLKIQALCR